MNDDLMTKPKILWFSHSPLSISESFIADTIQLLKLDHEVRVVSGSDGSLCAYPDLDVRFTSHSKMRERSYEKVLRLWKKKELHSERTARQVEVVLDAEFQDYRPDVLWVCYGTSAYDARRFLANTKVPFFIEVHGYDVSSQFGRASYRSSFVALANRSAGVICASEHTRRLCTLAGVNPDRIHVVRYSLDSQRIAPTGQPKTNYPSLIHFGRLTAKKHPLATLEAFRLLKMKVPDARMTFIGSGDMGDELERRTLDYGLSESVTVLPGMPQAQALELVEQHWIFCQHSVTALDGDQEGFSLSPAEAALLEMPVVSTYHNGIREHVLHERTGFLTHEYDFDAMAGYMERLVLDEALRLRMGEEGRASVSALCSFHNRRRLIGELVEFLMLCSQDFD